MSRSILFCTLLFVAPSLGSLPQFQLSGTNAETGAPVVDVTFPDGFRDTLMLSYHYSHVDDRSVPKESHCTFFGTMKSEKTACVAMTGCVGSEDVELTLNSKRAGKSNMFLWKRNGNVQLVTPMQV